MINPRAHIAEIRSEKYWLDETGRLKGKNPLASDLQDSIRHLAEGLYSKNAHFIFELIQNAEDNTYKVKEPSLSFRLVKTDPTETKGSDGVLIVQNNEIGFSTDNIEAICAVGKTTKSKIQGYIGEKGIGFKSVFRVTSNPHIFSNGYAFCLPEQDEETGLGYIVPQWIDNVPEGIDPSQTTIILPLDKADFGYGTIEEMLRDIEPETILFLSKLKEIKVETDTEDALTILKDDHNMPQVQIMLEGTMRGESFSKVDEFLLYSKTFDKPPDIFQEKRIGIDQRDVSIAFPLSEDKGSAGKIFAYLPVRSDTGLPFLINADFILTSSREEILNIPWNRRWLMGCVAELAAFAVPQLKERGLLTIDLLEALVSRVQEISENSIFYPIFHAVRDILLNQELLPADGGTFASARNVKLAGNADLRGLISNDQLRELHQADSDLKWLSGEITERRTPNLRNYLMKVLSVAEIDPDGFTRKLTDSFLEDQSDEWMIALYLFVAPLKALWKPGSGYGNPTGPLRSKQFIRLQDGSHVRPFQDDDSPNAYLTIGSDTETSLPIVKTEISRHEDVYQFLRDDLKIPELDIVVEVIERILPKYSSPIPADEHRRDIEKIVRAYTMDSQEEKKRRLKKKLQETPFILARAAGLELVSYHKPNEIYFKNDELMLYFCGNDTVGFVSSDDYEKSALEVFKDLGVCDDVRVDKRSSNRSGFIIIMDWYGSHKRGLKGFDPDIRVDGLKHALTSPTFEKSAFIWNHIAIPNAACIRGTDEESTRQTYENSIKEERVSDFGRLLIEIPWLPVLDGKYVKPSDLYLDDLPESFVRDEKLADQLLMKKDVVAKLAEQAGVQAEDIELLKQHPEEFQKWKADIRAKDFPIKPSVDPERREKKIIEKYRKAPKKKYEKISQSIKTTENMIDAKTWLNEKYKNNAGELICQICKKEMPFKKRDGNYYFEAVEILRDFGREMEELHIALCPLCSAMYNEFVKRDEEAMESFRNALINSDKPEIPLRLGEMETSVRFVESHFQDIKTILELQG